MSDNNNNELFQNKNSILNNFSRIEDDSDGDSHHYGDSDSIHAPQKEVVE